MKKKRIFFSVILLSTFLLLTSCSYIKLENKVKSIFTSKDKKDNKIVEINETYSTDITTSILEKDKIEYMDDPEKGDPNYVPPVPLIKEENIHNIGNKVLAEYINEDSTKSYTEYIINDIKLVDSIASLNIDPIELNSNSLSNNDQFLIMNVTCKNIDNKFIDDLNSVCELSLVSLENTNDGLKLNDNEPFLTIDNIIYFSKHYELGQKYFSFLNPIGTEETFQIIWFYDFSSVKDLSCIYLQVRETGYVRLNLQDIIEKSNKND